VGVAGDRLALRADLANVRFIGGSSGSGKSTVARILAAGHGLRLYATEPFSPYVPRTTPHGAPLLHAFLAMDMDERWVTRSPEAMYATFHGFHGETFPLVVEDVVALATHEPVLVEGFSLLPHLVAPVLSRPDQAVWLLATPEFRRFAFASRGSTWDIPRRTTDPDRALRNLLARDALFGEKVRGEAEALGLQVIEIDVGMQVDELVRLVTPTLGLA
jgi:2-phosphoglycerate kinase